MSDKMTKSERVELGQLIRKRERVMKSYANERAAKMMAEFDEQSAKIFSFDEDEVWEEATLAAQKVVADANAKISKRSRELGIPAEFAPSIYFGWIGRGQNAVAGRRAELRRMAVSRVKAIEAETVVKIERMSLAAQTAVVANGLESKDAQDFLNNMPDLETLMPSLDVAQLKEKQDELRLKNRRPWE